MRFFPPLYKPVNVFALTTVYATQKASMRAAQAKWDKLQRGVVDLPGSRAG
ncbi:UNVERIFIED_ORG: hypothetical protein M2402_003868 [Rahnella aquatilis]